MTVALGASAYSVAMFHLMTHAFFKALLFLAAGSVIIGMHHDQDIRNMGGLCAYMPITWITSLIGSLALIGTPFFAGFYSKDSIIEAVALSPSAGRGFRVVRGDRRRVRHRASTRSACTSWCSTARSASAPRPTMTMPPRPPATTTRTTRRWCRTSRRRWSGCRWCCWPSRRCSSARWRSRGMLCGDFFGASIVVNGAAHPAMEELAREFHGWAPMALAGFLGLPFWLAAAGVAVAWVLYCAAARGSGADRGAGSAGCTGCSTRSTTSTASTMSSSPAAPACSAARSGSRATSRSSTA